MSPPSVQSAVGDFFVSIMHVGSSFVQAIIALLGATLAFGQSIISTIIEVGQAVLKLGTDIFQSVVGFAFGKANVYCTVNMLTIGVCSKSVYSGYHWRGSVSVSFRGKDRKDTSTSLMYLSMYHVLSRVYEHVLGGKMCS